MTFGPVIFFFFLLFVIWKVSTRGVYNIGWTKRYYIERIGEIIIINNFQQHRLGRRVWICFGENIGEKMEGKEKGTQTNAKSSRGRGTGSNLKVIASEQKWLWGSMPRWNENGSGGRRASREKTNKQNKRQKQLVCVGRIAREEKITPPFILREQEMLMDECARKEKGKHFSSVSLARGSVRKKDNPMLYTKHAISSSWPYSTTFFIPTMCLGGLVIVMLFASERRLRWFTFFCCYFDLSQGPPIFNFNDREREREKRNHWRLKQKRCIVRTDQPKIKGEKEDVFFCSYLSFRKKKAVGEKERIFRPAALKVLASLFAR